MSDLQRLVHLDNDWLWRFSFVDRSGKAIATSDIGYFTQAEARSAMASICGQPQKGNSQTQ
jgi:uncharacterized protein YegP (UPF0339 family)